MWTQSMFISQIIPVKTAKQNGSLNSQTRNLDHSPALRCQSFNSHTLLVLTCFQTDGVGHNNPLPKRIKRRGCGLNSRRHIAAKQPWMWQRAGSFLMHKEDHSRAPGYNYILQPDHRNNWTVAINSLVRKRIK